MTFLRSPRTRQLTARRLGSDLGATAVEYALLVAGVALVMIVGVAFVGASIGGGVATAAEALSTGAEPAVGGTEADDEQAADEQAAGEQAADDARMAAEQKAAQDKAAQDEATEQKAAQDKAAQDKAAADRAAADRAAADRAAADRAAASKECAKNKNFSWNDDLGTCVKHADKDAKDNSNDDDNNDDDDDADKKKKNR